MDVLLKILLPVYLVLFFGIIFVWRSYQVWKKTGVNPFKFKKTDNAHDTIGKSMSFTWVLCVIIVGLHSISDQVYGFLIPIFWLETPSITLVGLAVLTFSLAWVIFSQAHMGNAWRVGIDSENPSNLVQSGVFAHSRNPIFLGMVGLLLGLLLSLPNAISLLTFGLGFVLLQIQVRLEEEHLLNTHGSAYQEYFQRVPRWF